jgi:hypothetical protein
MATTKKLVTNDMEQVLDDMARTIANRVFNDNLQVAIDEYEEKRDEYLAKALIKIRKWTNISDNTHEIIITITKDKV